jgi:hypothetical protein
MDPPTNEPRASAALRRFEAFGRFALAHLAGFLATTTCLIAIPAVAWIVLYFVLIFIAAATHQDLGGRLVLPFGLIGIVIAGGATTAGVCAAGVLTDVLRRALRWPAWTSPLAVYAILGATASIWRFGSDARAPVAFFQAAFLTAAGMAAFAVYWVPLAASDLAMRLAARWMTKLGAKLRERRDRELQRRSAA